MLGSDAGSEGSPNTCARRLNALLHLLVFSNTNLYDFMSSIYFRHDLYLLTDWIYVSSRTTGAPDIGVHREAATDAAAGGPQPIPVQTNICP